MFELHERQNAEAHLPYNTGMEAYRAEATIELGGKLHLDHLPFKTGERVEVVVIASSPRDRNWPDGYFAATFGAINDDSFVRHPQGEFDVREPLG